MSKIYDAEMQYLNVAFAKDVGLNAGGCVEVFESDRITREDAGLRPLLIYSITAPCYGVKARLLVDAAAPISISEFLSKAWSAPHCIGMPQSLEMESVIFNNDQGFVAWCQAQGVECKPAVSVKSLRALARSAQRLRLALSFKHLDSTSNAATPLAVANESLHYYDHISIALSFGYRKSFEQMTFDAWLARGQPFLDGDFKSNDWNAESLIEPVKALPKPQFVALQNDEDAPLHVHGLKELVAMWPGGRRAFFSDLETTARDFDHWISGRAHLPRRAMFELLDKAGAAFDDRFDGYIIKGGQVLIGKTPKGVDLVYSEISNGGDLEYAFEILPPTGKTLPMRSLVFGAWGGRTTLILIPQESKNLGKLLDSRSLINQTAPRTATPAVMTTLCQIIAHCDQLESPKDIGFKFGQEHMSWLTSGCSIWQP